MSPRSDPGWQQYRAAEHAFAAECRRPRTRHDWTAFDSRLSSARSWALRDDDSHLLGAAFELQAARWELARLQGEVLAALGGALLAYERIIDLGQRLFHVDRVKQLIANWYQIPSVFVSYARRDRRRVAAIIRHLEGAAGAQVIVDATAFIPGLDLARNVAWAMAQVESPARRAIATLVHGALRVAGVYLVMWSRTYAARPWTTWELEAATEQQAAARRINQVGPRLIFVRLDAHPLPAPHGHALWIDVSGGLTSATRARLVRAVTSSELLSAAPTGSLIDGPRPRARTAPAKGDAPAGRVAANRIGANRIGGRPRRARATR